MNYTTETQGSGTEKGGSMIGNIDIFRILKLILYKLWAIILVGLIVGGCSFLYAKAPYVKRYKTPATLVFTTKTFIPATDAEG